MTPTTTLKPHKDYYYNNPYLLLNGTEGFVDDIICELKKIGIDVAYHAKPLYISRNGVEYDWFVKLTKDVALSVIFEFINDYNKQILAGRTSQLENQEELKTRYRTLQAELGALQKQTSDQNQTTSSQTSKIGELTSELELFEEDNKDLVLKLKALDSDLNRASEGREQLEMDLRLAQARIRTLESEIQEAQDTALSLQKKPDKRGLDSLFKALWQDVEFLRDSVALIEIELDYNLVMPKLRAIIDGVEKDNNTTVKEQGKNLESAKGWHEVRFTTGSNDDGRIYFTFKTGQNKRKIIVSKKAEQIADISYMKKIRL